MASRVVRVTLVTAVPSGVSHVPSRSTVTGSDVGSFITTRPPVNSRRIVPAVIVRDPRASPRSVR